MLGLVSAAVLLMGPTLALASSTTGPAESPTVYVWLDFPHEDQGHQRVGLPLNVRSNGPECDQAVVEAQGQVLKRRSESDGYGILPTDQGSYVRAYWTYDCVGATDVPGGGLVSPLLQQVLFVSLDTPGQEASNNKTKFAITFRQDPPEIIAVHGAAFSMVDDGDTSVDEPTEDVTLVSGVLPALKEKPLGIKDTQSPSPKDTMGNEMKLLRYRIRRLNKLVAAKEKEHWERYGLDVKNFDPENTYLLDVTAPQDEDTFSDSDGTFMTTATQDQRERPLTSANNADATSTAPQCRETPLSSRLSSFFLDEDLFTVLGLAAIFFGLLSLFGIAFLHKRLQAIKTKRQAQRARHRRIQGYIDSCRRETSEERRARQAVLWEARREAVRSWFRGIFKRIFSRDEEKYGMIQQDQVEVRQPATVEENQTTMEQEIAEFRRAAFMIDNLVASNGAESLTAAEEGRMQRRPAVARPPVAHHRRTSLDYSSGEEYDESLPAYEEAVPAVADGFRYAYETQPFAPNGHSAPARTPSDTFDDSNSDRLGYNK